MGKAFVRRSRFFVALLAGALATASVVAGDGVQQDLQQWTLFRVSTPIEQRWTFSFQAEGRFGDDISEVSEVLGAELLVGDRLQQRITDTPSLDQRGRP